MIQKIELVSLYYTIIVKNKILNSCYIEVPINSNGTQLNDEYPTIVADVDALEVLSQKGISTKGSAANTPKQFGCGSYCQNQGVCVLAAQTVSCQCPTGYSGVQCQIIRKIKETK